MKNSDCRGVLKTAAHTGSHALSAYGSRYGFSAKYFFFPPKQRHSTDGSIEAGGEDHE